MPTSLVGTSRSMSAHVAFSEDILDALDDVYLTMLEDYSDKALPELHYLWMLLREKADEERTYDD